MRVKLSMETLAPARARSGAGTKKIVISSNRWIVAELEMGESKYLFYRRAV